MIDLNSDRLIEGRLYWFITKSGRVDQESVAMVKIDEDKGVCIYPSTKNGSFARGNQAPTSVELWFETKEEAEKHGRIRKGFTLDKRRAELMTEVMVIDNKLKELFRVQS